MHVDSKAILLRLSKLPRFAPRGRSEEWHRFQLDNSIGVVCIVSKISPGPNDAYVVQRVSRRLRSRSVLRFPLITAMEHDTIRVILRRQG